LNYTEVRGTVRTVPAGCSTAYNKSVAGCGPCGASAATFGSVTPRAGHESRRALRFGNAGTL